jgi:hypothetical protein
MGETQPWATDAVHSVVALFWGARVGSRRRRLYPLDSGTHRTSAMADVRTPRRRRSKSIRDERKHGVDCLGYHFGAGKTQAAWQKLQEVQGHEPPDDQANLPARHMTQTIVDMNHMLSGWVEYFKHSDFSSRKMDSSNADCANEVIGKGMPKRKEPTNHPGPKPTLTALRLKTPVPQRAGPLEGKTTDWSCQSGSGAGGAETNRPLPLCHLARRKTWTSRGAWRVRWRRQSPAWPPRRRPSRRI